MAKKVMSRKLAARVKASAKKVSAEKKVEVVVPAGPTYDDLLAMRRLAEDADEHVQVCIRLLNRAKSTTADFPVRDRNVREAVTNLAVAREDAEEARAAFQRLR